MTTLLLYWTVATQTQNSCPPEAGFNKNFDTHSLLVFSQDSLSSDNMINLKKLSDIFLLNFKRYWKYFKSNTSLNIYNDARETFLCCQRYIFMLPEIKYHAARDNILCCQRYNFMLPEIVFMSPETFFTLPETVSPIV